MAINSDIIVEKQEYKTPSQAENQPINFVRWIHREELIPNAYNPNHVAPLEMKLLKTSILDDGWLFPIVVFPKEIHVEGLTNNPDLDKHTVIDGFHRYKTSGIPEIYALTGGYVPCVVLNPNNALATTVRLNRAKGTHAILPMAKIVQKEIDAGKDMKQIQRAFGMEDEEVRRLSIRVGIPLQDLGDDYSKAWVPA